MVQANGYIIGIDTGGTFTDVVVMSPGGEVWTAKASTTPDEFSRGVMDALTEAARVLEGGLENPFLIMQGNGGVAQGGYGLCGGYPSGKSVLRYMVDAGMERGPDENYKNYALRRILDLNDYMDDALPSGEPYIGEYHEYSCPGCQVQSQVDLFCPPMGGDPILWDTRIDV